MGSGLLLLLQVAVAAMIDPDADADDAVGGPRRRVTVVDLGVERVERDAALHVVLAARDLVAAEAAADLDVAALGALAHGVLDRALHGPAERSAAFELLGDVLGHQLGADVRLAH